MDCVNDMRFHTQGNVTTRYGFFLAEHNSSIIIRSRADFSDCASVTGKQYYLLGTSYLYSSGKTLPGTEAGYVETGCVIA